MNVPATLPKTPLSAASAGVGPALLSPPPLRGRFIQERERFMDTASGRCGGRYSRLVSPVMLSSIRNKNHERVEGPQPFSCPSGQCQQQGAKNEAGLHCGVLKSVEPVSEKHHRPNRRRWLTVLVPCGAGVMSGLLANYLQARALECSPRVLMNLTWLWNSLGRGPANLYDAPTSKGCASSEGRVTPPRLPTVPNIISLDFGAAHQPGRPGILVARHA